MIYRWRMVPNALKALWRNLVRLVLRKPMIVSQERQQERLDECINCDECFEGQCQICLCNIHLKSLFYSELCPKGKW